MTGFGAYEFLVYVVPGGMLLVTLMVLFPKTRDFFGKERIDTGGFGLFVIVAFILGLAVNMIASSYLERHLILRGSAYEAHTLMSQDLDLVAPKVRQRFLQSVRSDFPELAEQLDACNLLATTDAATWTKPGCKDVRGNIVRRVHTKIVAGRASDRLDIYGQHYAVSLAATITLGLMLVILLATFSFQWFSKVRIHYWTITKIPLVFQLAALVAVAGSIVLCLQRIEFFDQLFARELFNSYAFMPRS